jgi:hypothetical protein
VTAARGVKFDEGKDPWHLVPLAAVREVVRVLAFGAKKYAPGDWKNVDNPIDRYFDALVRHVVAWRCGEKEDPETGIPPPRARGDERPLSPLVRGRPMTIRGAWATDGRPVQAWAGDGVVAFSVGETGKVTQISPDDAERFAAQLTCAAEQARRMGDSIDEVDTLTEAITSTISMQPRTRARGGR